MCLKSLETTDLKVNLLTDSDAYYLPQKLLNCYQIGKIQDQSSEIGRLYPNFQRCEQVNGNSFLGLHKPSLG